MNTKLQTYLKQIKDRIPPEHDIMMKYPLSDLKQDLDFLHGDKFPDMLAHARVDVPVLVEMVEYCYPFMKSGLEDILENADQTKTVTFVEGDE